MAMLAAFRAEIGAAVRSASPLLAPMLAMDGMTLDGAAMLLDPQLGWPGRPRLSGTKGSRSVHSHLLRHHLAGLTPTSGTQWAAQISSSPLVGRRFERVDGDYLRLEVADHSLELEAQIGPIHVRTRFGELRIQLNFDMPLTLAGACVGRLVEEIVDHASWRGRGWRIAAVEEGGGFCGHSLVVVTGSIGYRMKWVR